MPIHDLSIDDGPLMSSWGGKRIPFMEEGKKKKLSHYQWHLLAPLIFVSVFV